MGPDETIHLHIYPPSKDSKIIIGRAVLNISPDVLTPSSVNVICFVVHSS